MAEAPTIGVAHGIRDEIAVLAVPDDDRVWVPQADGVQFRPGRVLHEHGPLVQLVLGRGGAAGRRPGGRCRRRG